MGLAMVKIWIPLVLVAAVIASCDKEKPSDKPQPDDREFRLPVIETTDLHG